MRILLVGRTGQVGWELERSLSPLGELIAIDRARLDLSDPEAIRQTMRSVRPEWIVNAAAYTNVDGAEDDGATAFAINCGAPEAMAQEARRLGAALIHYSTDYVFDGSKPDPYVESDVTAPLNVYGRSKLAGEEAIRASGAGHLILRTSWVYASRGRNFLRTILRLAGEREVLRVVNDQFGAPTWARFIAEVTAAMLWRARFDASARERIERGETVHLANGGSTTWCGFARKAIALYAQRTGARLAAVEAIAASAYPTKAVRPRNSRLDLTRLTRDWTIAAPDWEDSLALCVDEIAVRQ
jgi:dTDP-4-dehydrorhamnose reductase